MDLQFKKKYCILLFLTSNDLSSYCIAYLLYCLCISDFFHGTSICIVDRLQTRFLQPFVDNTCVLFYDIYYISEHNICHI